MENSYVYSIFSEGICPSLIPGTVFYKDDRVILQPDSAGTVSIGEIVSHMQPGGEGRFTGSLFGETGKLLMLLEKTAEAAEAAWDYMVFPHMLSFDCREIFFSLRENKAYMMPKSRISPGLMSIKDENDILVNGFAELLYQADSIDAALGAADIAERILRAQQRESLNIQGILGLLSRWRCELI